MWGQGSSYRYFRRGVWTAQALILASALALLPACGGGDDHSDGGTPPPKITGTGSAPTSGPGDVEILSLERWQSMVFYVRPY